jgi:hypothetical protein
MVLPLSAATRSSGLIAGRNL